MINRVTEAVTETLASDREGNELANLVVKNVLTEGKFWPESDRLEFKLDEKIGDAICTAIGERLSLRYDGAVKKDGLHDVLWMTFMGSVFWAEVGKYFRDGELPENWRSKD